MIEELLSILKPFAIATTVLSGSSYATISIVSPLICKFCSSLDEKEGDSENSKQIKAAIWSDLKECYKGDTAKMLQEAAFLDPRFKHLNFLSSDEKTDTIERVKVKMLPAASGGSLSCEDSETEPHQSTESQPPKKKKKKNALTILFDDITPPTPSKVTDEEKVETELLRYNHEEILSYESDPLEWWKVKSTSYPSLSVQVRRMWTLPASNVRSEEIFKPGACRPVASTRLVS